MEVNKYRKRMVAVQRSGALRVACAYRTVSEEAVAVIADMIPIDLLARKRKQIYDRSAEVGRAEAANEARRQTLQTWQESWRAGTKGRWTHLLVAVECMLSRKDGWVAINTFVDYAQKIEMGV